MKTIKIFLSLSLTLLCLTSYGQIIFSPTAPSDYWMCRATDFDQKVFIGDSQYQRTALVQAISQCKKQSRIPSSCKASSENCDGILSGSMKRAVWQCTSLDTLANYWHSTIAKTDIEAALSAKAICQSQSAVPETCYVNMITCENLNTEFVDILKQKENPF